MSRQPRGFTPWVKWEDRKGKFTHMERPGVYAIAESNKEPKAVSEWPRQIIYIGMTHAKGGLKSRLHDFDYAIRNGHGHSGGNRVFAAIGKRGYSKFVKNLYVSVLQYKCEVASPEPNDLRTIGDIRKQEYKCFACFMEKHKELPRHNRLDSR